MNTRAISYSPGSRAERPRPGAPIMADTAMYQLVLLAKHHRNELARELADLGMYIGQEQLLLQWWDKEGLTQTELVERVQAVPATVTKMLQRMERAGLVRRERGGRRGRASRVYLTERGWELRGVVEVLWHRAEERLVGNLSGTEYALLRELLTKMQDL